MAITIITQPAVLNFSKNFIPVKLNSDAYLVGGEPVENFAIYIELWMQNQAHTDFELVVKDFLPIVFGTTGIAETDFQDAIHSLLEIDGPDYIAFADKTRCY
jgi:hypothetical protein